MAEANTQSIAVPEGASDMGAKLATVAAVAVGVALIEVELIPGMLIGVAAMLAPKLLPGLGNSLRPLMKTAMRAGYATYEKTREMLAEAGEQLQDVAAEARHEQSSGDSETPRKASRKKRSRAA